MRIGLIIKSLQKMKKTLFLILALLLSIAVKAQDFKDFYTIEDDGSVELDITNYDFHERLYTVYNIYINNRFEISEGEAYGLFKIKSYDDINAYLKTLHADFNELSKYDLDDLYNNVKNNLPKEFVTSLLFDISLQQGKSRNDNDHCVDSDPFCTSEIITFEASHSTDQAEPVPDKACLGATYNPSWYHMRINTPGQFIIHMEGVDPNNSSVHRDIDYCIWGPFSDPTSPCVAQLNTAHVIDCSYSPSYSENVYLGFQDHSGHTHTPYNYHVPETGEYYILLITNYSCDPCVISFTKQANSGPGTTDCSILEPFLTSNAPCYGTTLQLQAEDILGASYTWTSPDNQTYNDRVWIRSNATFNMSGQYSCHVTSGNQSGTETLQVVVLPNINANFTVGNTIAGEPVQFTGTETTTPSGYNNMITERHWNFGDGTNSTQANPTHTYSNPGNYTVSYTVRATGGLDGVCEDTKTIQITITNQLNATAISENGTSFCADDAVPNLKATASGGYGNYTYHWTASPQCPIDYENSATTAAHPAIGTTTFTCTISDGHNTITKTVSITVNVIPDATITGPNPAHINYGGSATLSAPQLSGATYQWSSNPANQIQSGQGTYQITTKNLTAPTEFFVTVSKNNCSETGNFMLLVGDQLYGTISGPSGELCAGESTSLTISPSGGSEQYTFNWQPENLIEGSHTQQSITTKPLSTSTVFTCVITDTENHTYTATSTVIVNPMPEAIASSNYTNVLEGHHVILTAQPVANASCSWTPRELIGNIIDPWTAKTIDLPENENTVFHLTVETTSHCSSQDDITVTVYKSLNESYVTTNKTVICEDDNVQLTAYPNGGTGNYSYHWTPEALVQNPYSASTIAYPTLDNHLFTCTITDDGIDDLANNKTVKNVDIEVHETPHISTDLLGRDFIVPGIGMIPYIYEYNVDVLNLHGYGLDNPSIPSIVQYSWSLETYYDVPNHVPGTLNESTWLLQEEGGTTAYVLANAEGCALLKCSIMTPCGITETTKFIYTNEEYYHYYANNEVNYDNLVTIYPNPTNGDINIKYGEQITESPLLISIYSYNGELIDQIEEVSGNSITSYSMSGYANGLYLIRITGKDFAVTKKFLLNR